MKNLLLTTLLFLGFGYAAYAEKITNYKIDVNVEQSGELSIVESIEYDFEAQKKHGMFRDIPFTIKRGSRIIDLGLYDFSVQMDDGMVEWQQSTMNSTNAGEIIRLKIGSASSYVTGKHLYKINYRVKMGVLPAAQNEDDDSVRWNIIGTGWKIPIENVEANFFLPPSLSQLNIALSTFTGKYGSTSSTATSQWVNPQQVEVKVKYLSASMGATVELAYPSGLLDQNGKENIKASLKDSFLANWHWGALVGFLVYFWSMFKRYTGFEDKRSIAVQYGAPKGLSLLQSGLVLDKFADNEDFSAAILELGHLGYLTIKQEDKKSTPILIKTHKKFENLTMDQKYILNNILFKGTNSFVLTSRTASRSEILQNGFEHINKNLYIWSVSDGYMAENPQRVRKSFLWKSLLLLLPVLVLGIYSLFTKYGEEVILLAFPLVFGGVGLSMILGKKQWSAKFSGLVFTVLGIAPVLMMSQKGLNLQEILVGPLGVLILLIVVMYFTYKKMGNTTQKGAYASKHLLGLKEFIKRVKQDEIKRRLEMDPLYLEKMLPYAVLFGETKHWLSFYDLLNVKTPYWYSGNIHNMNNFSSSVDNAATSPNTSSSGGGGFSGGGGSSGGGGGGGGGGSW